MPKSGVRSPTSHRTPEQIREHGRTYQARPEVKKRRAERNKVAAAKGSSSTQDNAHSTPLVKKKTPGGKTTKQSVAKNRGHGMGKNGTRIQACSFCKKCGLEFENVGSLFSIGNMSRWEGNLGKLVTEVGIMRNSIEECRAKHMILHGK